MKKFAFILAVISSTLSFAESPNKIKAILDQEFRIDHPEFYDMCFSDLDGTDQNDLIKATFLKILYETYQDEEVQQWLSSQLKEEFSEAEIDEVYDLISSPAYQKYQFRLSMSAMKMVPNLLQRSLQALEQADIYLEEKATE